MSTENQTETAAVSNIEFTDCLLWGVGGSYVVDEATGKRVRVGGPPLSDAILEGVAAAQAGTTTAAGEAGQVVTLTTELQAEGAPLADAGSAAAPAGESVGVATEAAELAPAGGNAAPVTTKKEKTRA